MASPHPAPDIGRAPEPTLVARIRVGDARAFEALFRAHFASLCSLAFSFVRAPDAAEDVVQNVFWAVWMRRRLWHVHGTVGAYLRQAVRHEALTALRGARRERDPVLRAGRDASLTDVERDAGTEDIVAAAELAQAVVAAAHGLPPRCRAVFLLKWERGLTYREIADRLNLSIKTVEMQMTRALKSIRARVADPRRSHGCGG
jgi:RNA polymerase sigma-70 factor (ECF subfamily)